MNPHAVVITGLGLCTPFGVGIDAFFEGLRRGRNCASIIHRFETTGLHSKLGCFVSDDASQTLNHKFLRLPLAYQYSVVAVQEAIANSSLNLKEQDRDRVGIFFGSPSNTQNAERFHSTLIERGPRFVSPLGFENMTYMAGPGSVSLDCQITGPTVALPGGFASGLQALHLANVLIGCGRIDVALVVAAEEIASIYYRSLCYLGLLSPHGRGGEELCRPFDAKRDGMVVGEGAVALVLETASNSARRQQKIHAQVAASAVSHDGYRMADISPSGLGLERALRLALEKAAVKSNQVDYLAACANSMQALDRAEATAVTRVFGQGDTAQLAVSSVKSMMGETGSAGGLINVAACLFAIEEGCIPPNINFVEGDGTYALDIVAKVAREKRVDMTVANAYSFGGTGACVVLRRWASS